MSVNDELTISQNILKKLLKAKKDSGFEDKNWDEWFLDIFSDKKSSRDKSVENFFYKNDFDQWVQNFTLNLSNIQSESSAKEIILNHSTENDFAIIIGAGPSLKKNHHLEKLAKSNWKTRADKNNRIDLISKYDTQVGGFKRKTFDMKKEWEDTNGPVYSIIPTSLKGVPREEQSMIYHSTAESDEE